MLSKKMKTSKEQKKVKSDSKLKWGNPDFFFIAFLAIAGIDLGIERFASGTWTLLFGIPVAIIGLIISIYKWKRLLIRQKVFAVILLASILLGIYLFLPGL